MGFFDLNIAYLESSPSDKTPVKTTRIKVVIKSHGTRLHRHRRQPYDQRRDVRSRPLLHLPPPPSISTVTSSMFHAPHCLRRKPLPSSRTKLWQPYLENLRLGHRQAFGPERVRRCLWQIRGSWFRIFLFEKTNSFEVLTFILLMNDVDRYNCDWLLREVAFSIEAD